MTCDVQYQKFIAYALIGYAEVVKRTGRADYDINSMFGPLGMTDSLSDLGVDERIVDAIKQIDEIDVLKGLLGADKFDEFMEDNLSPILSFISQNAVNTDCDVSAVRKLLRT